MKTFELKKLGLYANREESAFSVLESSDIANHFDLEVENMPHVKKIIGNNIVNNCELYLYVAFQNEVSDVEMAHIKVSNTLKDSNVVYNYIKNELNNLRGE